jgi:3-dehydroquinate synthase
LHLFKGNVMHTVNVKLGEHSYNIVTGERILSGLGQAVRALNCGQDAVVISNPIIMRHHGAVLLRSLHKAGITTLVLEVPSGERSKSAPVAFKLIEKLAQHDVRRKLFVVAFGGGVVGDLAGYVAAAYKRGIPYIQVPTTLLAQVDSAIGGKVAVDLPMGKNLVGAFYQPRIVWSDVDVLKSLTLRQIRNGLAEVIKYGIICDKSFFDYVDQNIGRLLKRDPRIMTQVINDCSAI